MSKARDNKKLLVGLDIGTSKIVAIVAQLTPEGAFELIGMGQHPSRGLKKGVVVNIIGLAGESFNYDYVAGTTANAGLMAFTRAVGSKSVDQGVRVVAINPPGTRTDRMTTLLRSQAQQQFGDPERWAELTKHMPFGRPAEPDEVADLAVFLASDRASYISGVVMTLDAGQAARH